MECFHWTLFYFDDVDCKNAFRGLGASLLLGAEPGIGDIDWHCGNDAADANGDVISGVHVGAESFCLYGSRWVSRVACESACGGFEEFLGYRVRGWLVLSVCAET